MVQTNWSEGTAVQLTCAVPMALCKSNMSFQLAASPWTVAQGRMLNQALSLPFLLGRSGGLARLPCRVLRVEQVSLELLNISQSLL
jgi:hypothetical protein